MLKLNHRKSWLTFLFTTYGVPALLMIAVLPANHAKMCACFRAGIPIIQAPQPSYYCAACAFLSTTSLDLPETAASAAGPQIWALDDVVFATAPASFSPHCASRAHSPPSA